MDITIKTSLKFIFEGRLERKYIFAENSSCPKIVVINLLISSILFETIIPRIAPIKVPKIPIIEPVKKKIRIIWYFDAPIVLISAISDFLVCTNMIIEEIILNAATRIINVRIRNITFFSTFKALIKEEFLFFQSIIEKLSFNLSLISS